MSAHQPSRAGTVPWPDEAVARYVAKGYWEGRALTDHIYAAVDVNPGKVYLVDGDVRLTGHELIARTDGAAVRLRALGLRADDRIVITLPNGWEFVVLTLACLRLGVIPVMALPAHRHIELTSMAALTEARAIAVPATVKGYDHQTLAQEVVDSAPSLAHVLVSGEDIRAGHVDLGPLLEPAANEAVARAELDAAAPPGDAVALFLLSGGTTGIPKLIARTHNDYGYMMRRAAELCGVGRDDTYLAVLPLGHGFPMSGPGVLGTLRVGGRAVIAASPESERAFAAIEQDRVTITSVVPAIVQRWMEHRETDTTRDLSSLRLLQVGGSRLANEVARRITPTLGCTLQQVYGMSEGLLCLTRPDDPEEVICSTQGRPICDDDELLLINDEGEPAAPGEPGVLLTRGPYTPRGYYRAPDQNARAFLGDGWYRTGDIVNLRPDGNLTVEGRDKDVINRGGEKISAEEIENFAYQLDGVRLAAAVAMPDAELGERVCLYAVAHPGATVELADVLAVMRSAGVARFKLPDRLVLVDSLPTTNVGKIDKKTLRADIARRLADEQGPTALAS